MEELEELYFGSSGLEPVTLLSPDEYTLELSHTVNGRSYDWIAHTNEFESVMEQDVAPDDWMFVDESFYIPATLVEGLQSMIDDPFLPVPTTKVQPEVSIAMSQAIKTALNEEVSYGPAQPRVLLVGSGYGNDIKRILLALEKSSRRNCSVVCVEPGKERIDQSIIENPDAVHIHSDINGAYEELSQMPPFDFIVCTMSVQHLLARSNPLIDDFSSLLTPKGVVLGTYFDHDAYFSLYGSVAPELGGIMYVGPRALFPDTVKGGHPTRIYNSHFDDPYVDALIINEFGERHGLNMEVFKGVAALMRYGTNSLARTTKSKSIAASLVTLVRMTRRDLPPLSKPPDILAPLDPFKPGRAVQAKELYHFRPGQYALGLKRDGVKEVWRFDSRGLVSPDDVVVRLPVPDNPYYIQAERVGSQLYFVDCFSPSWGRRKVGFMERYSTLTVLTTIASQKMVVSTNSYVVPQDAHDILAISLKSWGEEGIFLVPLSGYTTENFSEFRFAKHTYTGDVKEAEGIVERSIASGKKLRTRPDKTVPNPAKVLSDLHKAPALKYVWPFLLAAARGSLEIGNPWELPLTDVTVGPWAARRLASILNGCSTYTEAQHRAASAVIYDLVERFVEASNLSVEDTHGGAGTEEVVPYLGPPATYGDNIGPSYELEVAEMRELRRLEWLGNQPHGTSIESYTEWPLDLALPVDPLEED